jgi:hypothetical protein
VAYGGLRGLTSDDSSITSFSCDRDADAWDFFSASGGPASTANVAVPGSSSGFSSLSGEIMDISGLGESNQLSLLMLSREKRRLCFARRGEARQGEATLSIWLRPPHAWPSELQQLARLTRLPRHNIVLIYIY